MPIRVNGRVVGVLDIDSDRLNDFDQTDRHHLEEVARILAETLYPQAE